ncbi:MAG: hypothetical protein AABX39_02890 [Nanoarchaeota archaeon]
MKKLTTIAFSFLLSSTFYPAQIKPFNQVCAQTDESYEERRDKELEEKSKSLKELIFSKEKGERLVIEDESGKSVLTKFVYENKGYVVCANKSETDDYLAILVHSLRTGTGHYVGLLEEKGILSSGYSTFYIASEDEKLLPEDITGCLPNHKLIQTRNYNSKKEETHNEKEYFLAELETTLDVLLDFYEE